MSAGYRKTIDGLTELGRVLATAQDELRVAQRMAATLPGDWTITIREMADGAELTGYALDQQVTRLLEKEARER